MKDDNSRLARMCNEWREEKSVTDEKWGFRNKDEKRLFIYRAFKLKNKIIIGRQVKIARYYFVIIEIRNFIQSILEIFGGFLSVKVNHVIIVRLI